MPFYGPSCIRINVTKWTGRGLLYRVIESVKNRVETNKTIIQRTTNTNAVQVGSLLENIENIPNIMIIILDIFNIFEISQNTSVYLQMQFC